MIVNTKLIQRAVLGVIVVCSYDLCQFEVIVHCYSTRVPDSSVISCVR